MDEQKLYYKYASKEERLAAWRENRTVYEEWRNSPECEAWIRKKRDSQLGLCFICMAQLKPPIHIDHIFPLYLGGTNAKANMCLTHSDCNMRKGATVYMTYKEACKRRELFNDLYAGVKLFRTLKIKPTHVPGKQGLRCMKLARQYFSEDKLDNMELDAYKKQRHQERLAKRRLSNAAGLQN